MMNEFVQYIFKFYNKLQITVLKKTIMGKHWNIDYN